MSKSTTSSTGTKGFSIKKGSSNQHGGQSQKQSEKQNQNHGKGKGLNLDLIVEDLQKRLRFASAAAYNLQCLHSLFEANMNTIGDYSNHSKSAPQQGQEHHHQTSAVEKAAEARVSKTQKSNV